MAVNPICMRNEGVTHYLIPCINYLKILCNMGGGVSNSPGKRRALQQHNATVRFVSFAPQFDRP